MTKKETENAAFSSTGVKFIADSTGDWETDTLRTGCLGSVTINLPRIAIECEKDKNKFIDLTKERYELAARALSLKSNALKQYGKNSSAVSDAEGQRRHILPLGKLLKNNKFGRVKGSG